jgi:hypothetical protein
MARVVRTRHTEPDEVRSGKISNAFDFGLASAIAAVAMPWFTFGGTPEMFVVLSTIFASGFVSPTALASGAVWKCLKCRRLD